MVGKKKKKKKKRPVDEDNIEQSAEYQAQLER